MKVQMNFSESNGNDFVEFNKEVTLADVDEFIAFCKQHGDEVWLGEIEWPVSFDRVVMMLDESSIRVELNFA